MAPKIDAFPMAVMNAQPMVKSVGWFVARYGLALVIAWIGLCKFFPFEAHNIEPLVANSPFMGWLYTVFSVETFSSMLGVVELVTALLLIIKPWYPTLSMLGSLLAILVFANTLLFMVTTPGVGEQSAGGFPLLSMTGQFLVKDIVLIGVSILTLSDAMGAIAHRAMSEYRDPPANTTAAG